MCRAGRAPAPCCRRGHAPEERERRRPPQRAREGAGQRSGPPAGDAAACHRLTAVQAAAGVAAAGAGREGGREAWLEQTRGRRPRSGAAARLWLQARSLRCPDSSAKSTWAASPQSALPEHFKPYLAALRKASPTELLNEAPSASSTVQKNSHLTLQARDASSLVVFKRTDSPVTNHVHPALVPEKDSWPAILS